MKKITAVLFILFANSSYAETYKCISQGKTTYTDSPCKNSVQTTVVLNPVNDITPATVPNKPELAEASKTAKPVANNYTLTIEEAYAAIPHKRTVFEPKLSSLPAPQAEILRQLFEMADEGIMLKVIAGKAMQANDSQRVKQVLIDYDKLLSHLSSLSVSNDINSIKNNLLTVIQQHQHHFQTKIAQFEIKQTYDQSFTPDIHNASRLLQQTYHMLMQAFPQESNTNKAAFYDYLCALDFI
jgi:Domain of unknown function (DUF4124)